MGELTTAAFVAWISLMLIGFLGSAMYSGIETGAYSINRVRLHLLAGSNKTGKTLENLLSKPTSLLGTLLIGNNVSNYLGTYSLSIILGASGLSDLQVIVLNTLLVTPILFVFGETLPKDLFSAQADRLLPKFTPVISTSRFLAKYSGLLPLIGWFTEAVMRSLGQGGKVNPFHPRRQVEVLVKEGVGYGLLSEEQSAIVGRVLTLTHTTVADVMSPWQEVQRVDLHAEPTILRTLAERSGGHRIFPVIDNYNQVVGIVDVIDALVHEEDQIPAIKTLMKPVVFISKSTPVREALQQFQQENIGLAIVSAKPQTDEDAQQPTPVGVVSIKDLIEPYTGELSRW